LTTAAAAAERIGALEPKPWPVDLEAAANRLAGPIADDLVVVWISGSVAAPGSEDFAGRLNDLGELVVVRAEDGGPLWLDTPEHGASALDLTLRRTGPRGEQPVAVRAVAEDERIIGRAEGGFAEGERTAAITMTLPTELRNDVVKLEVENQGHAGAVFLVDESFKRRPVGLVAATEFEGSQPLLDEQFYLDRALAPFSEIRRGSVETLLERELAVLILTDIGILPFVEAERLRDWMDQGGVVVRFAGPRLAAAGLERGGLREEDLLPVRIRRGERALGGALSWSRPEPVAPFPQTSPFSGLPVPEEVTVSRQILAEPAIDLDEKTWARLEDGTPLVTAAPRGDGWLILVHTTANADWSNLPLSGLFVDMLRRVVALSRGVGGGGEDRLDAFEVLDGRGRLTAAGPGMDTLPTDRQALGQVVIGPRNPPGFYGNQNSRRALNLGPALGPQSPRPTPPADAVQSVEAGRDVNLQGWLLAAALLLTILDTLIGLAMRGLLPLPGRRPGAAATTGVAVLLALGLALAPAGTARAQDGSDRPFDPELFALEASLETRLGYILTGDPVVDEISRDGLRGLSEMLTRRTAVEPSQPFGVDPEVDELAFFPLLYWPVTENQPSLSETASANLNAYMRNGGIILIDTQDRYEVGTLGSGTGSGLQRLIQIAGALEIPPLIPVGEDHVLTRTFYLLNDFPGRYTGGSVFVEDGAGSSDTEVSPVMLGSNDWAAAWARDQVGRFRFPVVPGGEIQREMAFRFGINLVMYALTGNYKADQVHVPSILERLGQ